MEAVHIIGWGIVFAFPFDDDTQRFHHYMDGLPAPWQHCSAIFSYRILLQLLLPHSRYLFEGRIRQYLLLNILLIACVTAGVHFGGVRIPHLRKSRR